MDNMFGRLLSSLYVTMRINNTKSAAHAQWTLLTPGMSKSSKRIPGCT